MRDTSRASVVGTAYEVQGETGTGIVVETAKILKDHVNAGSFTVLAERNGHLQAIGPDVKFYGLMEHIPDAGPNTRRLVKGDLIRYRFWTGNFYLIRGVRVDFTAGRVVPLCTRDCTLAVLCNQTPLQSEASVQLFDHSFGNPRTVALQKQTRIELLEAYVRDVADIDSVLPSHEVQPWLHVHIDENDGWISEPTDLQKVGLTHIDWAK